MVFNHVEEQHGKPIELFCLKDSVLMCVGCFINSKHAAHPKDCLQIGDAYTTLQHQLHLLSEVRSCAHSLNNYVQELIATHRKAGQCMTLLETMAAECTASHHVLTIDQHSFLIIRASLTSWRIHVIEL